MATEDKFDPHSIVTEEHVKKVICRDKGQEAKLTSWKIVDFMKKGENFGSLVTSIEVNYKLDGRPMNTVYIAKLNPSGDGNPLHKTVFFREAMFYSSILPELNATLVSIGQPPLNYAKYIYSALEKNQEQIYLEDLRERKFKKHDKQKGLDIKHINLCMEALARLHASSLVLQSKYSEPLEVKHSYLLEGYSNIIEYFVPMFETSLLAAGEMLEKIGGYERTIVWVKSLIPKIFDIATAGIKGKICNVVCQGDVWIGNFLFRYNCQGDPVEAVIVDEQLTSIASPTADLNYFIYTNIAADVRKSHLDSFLLTYYKTFNNVMESGGLTIPFTLEELQIEFKSKHKYGAITAMLLIQIIFLSTSEVENMDGKYFDPNDLGKVATESAINSMDTNPLVKQRFLGLFDDFLENGYIS